MKQTEEHTRMGFQTLKMTKTLTEEMDNLATLSEGEYEAAERHSVVHA